MVLQHVKGMSDLENVFLRVTPDLFVQLDLLYLLVLGLPVEHFLFVSFVHALSLFLLTGSLLHKSFLQLLGLPTDHTHTKTHPHKNSFTVSCFVCLYLSVYLSVCFSCLLSVCPSAHLSIYLPACLPVCLTICLSVGLSVCLGRQYTHLEQQVTPQGFDVRGASKHDRWMPVMDTQPHSVRAKSEPLHY